MTRDGKRVRGAEVKVMCSGPSAETNSRGFYEITDVPATTHIVLASGPGFSIMRHDVVVTEGETTTLDVNLDPVEEESSSSSLWIAGLAILVIAAIVVAALMLRKKGKGETTEPGLDETPPETGLQ